MPQYQEQNGDTCEGCAHAYSVGNCESAPECVGAFRADGESKVFVEVPKAEQAAPDAAAVQ